MFFLPGEVIHSREISSYRFDFKHQHEQNFIILCHKDKTSFYKSTRKSNRTASRVWSGLFPVNNNISSESSHIICDGYHVSTDSQQDANTAIHKRLTTEFGEFSTTIDIDIPNISVTKYSSSGDTIVRRGGVDVIFFELDTSTTDVDSDSTQDHFHLIQNTVSKLIKQDKNAIIHLKCDTIHRAISSSMSSKSNCISGVELEQYILDESKSSAEPIRRLRDKKGAANCPLTIYPPRYVEKEDQGVIEICRFHNYDAERGCLRMKRSKQNPDVKECEMDHDHCYRCGGSHRAFECPDISLQDTNQSSVVFRRTMDGIISEPFDKHKMDNIATRETSSLPALLVLGGRMRGRTLATCEILRLSTSTPNDKNQWLSLPNLQEHRGSHAACSVGCGLVFVMGGGTSDGNSDTVEVLDFTNLTSSETEAKEWRWHTLASKLSSPRHAFGAVSCITTSNDMTSISLYAVGGWQYGSLSCESLERLTFEYQSGEKEEGSLDMDWLYNHAQWELCAPLILPRRLHSVAASKDGSSIYVFGGFIDERRTTNSIERYDIDTDTWTALDELPFENCPLVQAVAVDESGFFVFPFSTEQSTECSEAPLVMRYTPGSDELFSPISIPNGGELRLPITSWHSFTATLSTTLNRLYLIGGTVKGKWTKRCYELDLDTLVWNELPPMSFPARRLATVVLE